MSGLAAEAKQKRTTTDLVDLVVKLGIDVVDSLFLLVVKSLVKLVHLKVAAPFLACLYHGLSLGKIKLASA